MTHGIVGPTDWRRLPSTENVAFRLQAGRSALVVRASPPGHRTFEEVVGELEWVRALGAAGNDVLSVSSLDQPFPVVDGQGHHWIVALFEWVPGLPPIPASVDFGYIRQWGRLLGEIHLVVPASGVSLKRARWRETANLDTTLLDGWTLVDRQEVDGLLAGIVLKGEERLLHGDLGLANLAGDPSRPVAVDFDDACLGPVAYDVAAALYDLVVDNGPFINLQASDAASAFLLGYGGRRPLTQSDLQDLGELWPALVVERSITARRLGVEDPAADRRLVALVRHGHLPQPVMEVDRLIRRLTL